MRSRGFIGDIKIYSNKDYKISDIIEIRYENIMKNGENEMKNVGILGLGNIANRVAKGVLCSEKACLYAAASRKIENAKIHNAG